MKTFKVFYLSWFNKDLPLNMMTNLLTTQCQSVNILTCYAFNRSVIVIFDVNQILHIKVLWCSN
jgi:hypothetical protein